MNLRADHPPIYAARSESGMAIVAQLTFALAVAMLLIPLAMTLKGMAGS